MYMNDYSEIYDDIYKVILSRKYSKIKIESENNLTLLRFIHDKNICTTQIEHSNISAESNYGVVLFNNHSDSLLWKTSDIFILRINNNFEIISDFYTIHSRKTMSIQILDKRIILYVKTLFRFIVF